MLQTYLDDFSNAHCLQKWASELNPGVYSQQGKDKGRA